MKKFLFIVCLFCFGIAYAQGVSIGKTVYVRDASQGGKGKEAELASLMNSMDYKAAENGDTPSMARVAQGCLKKKDYICAYKWSSLALTGTYFWGMASPTPVLEIRDTALDNMSDTERSKGLKQIKDYLKPKFEKMKSIPPDDTVGLSRPELMKKAKEGKIYAAGNLAKSCLKTKDYPCSFVWSSIASMGPLFWGKGEEILAIRDKSRKHLTSKEVKSYSIVIESYLKDMMKR